MIKASVSNLEKVKDFIKEVPRGVKIAAMREITEYILGDDRHGLRHEPKYKHVTRKSGMSHLSYTTKHGKTVIGYVSEKQHKWVMANYKSRGMGTNQRNHDYSSGWNIQEQNSDWRRVNIENEVPHADYVGGLNQARLNAKVGWRKYTAIIATNINTAIKRGQATVDKWVASRNKT